ncbi:glycosyltransferase family 4 protein [Bacillus sp. T33-2]|uniref:glycosyltransferase family 4 protein n=1 Tax=Bacillus sp. T33-2 TaxID=2054168 RepID=UPI000C768AF0|nr:MraY family glycosyltransferase [Bacillus sp. T33-2]PLR90797.1 undecaprenyl-phosphate alpha-N-acetylglucosaminyl 1-phosphate transferase [Bacillus sp. T33-2]
MLYLTLLLCFFLSLIITPSVKKLAFSVGATDNPNQRKVHTKTMPRLGGLAVFISFFAGMLIIGPIHQYCNYILFGSIIIILTGIIDDIIELSPKMKLLGQLIPAGTVLYGGLHIDFISLPFGMKLEFGWMSIPITLLWIIGITNSINLIDGLDGLASGVSAIALLSISGMAVLMNDWYVSSVGFILLASILGFLPYNFHPATIFLGDSGSLFLGYMIAVLSLLGFKNVTFISFIVPIVILGVPISDTLFAIIRRVTTNKPFSAPDKYHLHHCLLHIGFSHRQTVLIIYIMAVFFGAIGVIITKSNLRGTYIFIGILILMLELFAEKIGWVGKEFKPLLKIAQLFRLSPGKNE